MPVHRSDIQRKFPDDNNTPKPAVATVKGKEKKMSVDERYSFMKTNVSAHDLVRLGLTLVDPCGNLPAVCTFDDCPVDYSYCSGHQLSPVLWQFNFRQQHIDGDDHKEEDNDGLPPPFKSSNEGINPDVFRTLFRSLSGLFGRNDVTWVTFDGAYHLGYLFKSPPEPKPQSAIRFFGGGGGGRRSERLPSDLQGFKKLLRTCLGSRIYDVKHMARHCGVGRDDDGLEWLAEMMKVERLAMAGTVLAGGEMWANERYRADMLCPAGNKSLTVAATFLCLSSSFFSGIGLHCIAGVLTGFEPPFHFRAPLHGDGEPDR